jgi:hypothetical protein
MTILRARIWMHRVRFFDLETEADACSPRGPFRVGVTPTAPGDQSAAQLQERRCVLGDHVQGGKGSRGDEVEPVQAVRPHLGPGVHHAGVG